MAQENSQENVQNQEAEDQAKTPLELVRENQAMQQQNREVAEQRNEPSGEVPGASIPSDRRHHPQRQMYGQGTTES